MRPILAACVLAALLGACRSGDGVPAVARKPASGAKFAGSFGGAPGAAASAGQQALRFKKFSYVDQQGIGREAFSLLVPADWRFTGGIRWALDCPAMPAVLAFKMTKPDGAAEFEIFPNRMFSWTTDPTVQSMFPAGSRYLGAEVQPPVGAAEYLQRMLVRPRRGQAVGLQVVETTPLPELARALAGQAPPIPGATATTDAARIRIEYQQGGVPMEEDIYAVLQFVHIPFQGLYGVMTNTIWTADQQFSFKARQGDLEAATKMFQTMAFSFRLDLQWFNKYNQLVQQLTQNQIKQIESIGQLSRYISRTNDEISTMIRDSYEKQQATYDRLSSNFSQYIRGVDQYYDPIQEKPVELPSGYREAWTNPLGEYIVSDDPNYNPNIGSNASWQRLNKKD